MAMIPSFTTTQICLKQCNTYQICNFPHINHTVDVIVTFNESYAPVFACK